MTEDDERAIVAAMRAARAQARGYADFRLWPPDRDLEEWGVANTLRESAERRGEDIFRDLRMRGRGNDPPDCQALDLWGQPIAIEVTELVDPRAIVSFKHGGAYDWADWTQSKFLEALQHRLSAKDGRRPSLKGGPYAKYFVVVHTDEPLLTFESASLWLNDFAIAGAPNIDRAFLLLSYEPKVGYCPYIELRIDA